MKSSTEHNKCRDNDHHHQKWRHLSSARVQTPPLLSSAELAALLTPGPAFGHSLPILAESAVTLKWGEQLFSETPSSINIQASIEACKYSGSKLRLTCEGSVLQVSHCSQPEQPGSVLQYSHFSQIPSRTDPASACWTRYTTRTERAVRTTDLFIFNQVRRRCERVARFQSHLYVLWLWYDQPNNAAQW